MSGERAPGGMGNTVEAIFWDNDGVLVDTEQVYYESTRDTMATARIVLTPQDYLEHFLIQGRGAWHLAEERGIAPAEIVRLRDARNALYADRLAERSRLIEGVADVLAALHGRYVMGVVTSSRRDHFDVIHRSTGLLAYFDFVLTSEDFTHVKPNPEPYLKAVARSGAPAEACVAVEDSARGLAAAKAAGIGCIVIPTALTRGSRFDTADRVLATVTELLDVL